MRVWLDIDNPPQVQYLLPFRAGFDAIGAETVITARDYGDTCLMLAQAGVEAHVFGARVGRGMYRKVEATLARAYRLVRFFRARGCPDALLAASRSSAIAARWLGIPSFIIGDYEYANVTTYRLTRSTLLHPQVIDRSVFRRGLGDDQIVSFNGLKEDLTFADVDVDAIEPYDLGSVPEDLVRVLFRPPSETSHYYSTTSTDMARATLQHLAASGTLVVFSPRDHSQVSYLDGLDWAYPPIVLKQPVPFVSLLKSVDAVVCSGGTMLREAAFLGIPAYSIFQSEIGAVDRWLEQIGRATLIAGPDELRRIDLRRHPSIGRLDSNPQLLDELVTLIASRVGSPDLVAVR